MWLKIWICRTSKYNWVLSTVVLVCLLGKSSNTHTHSGVLLLKDLKYFSHQSDRFSHYSSQTHSRFFWGHCLHSYLCLPLMLSLPHAPHTFPVIWVAQRNTGGSVLCCGYWGRLVIFGLITYPLITHKRFDWSCSNCNVCNQRARLDDPCQGDDRTTCVVFWPKHIAKVMSNLK